jgi:hypothetical protein
MDERSNHLFGAQAFAFRAASDTGVKRDWEPQPPFEVHRIVGTRVAGVPFGAEDIPPPCGIS